MILVLNNGERVEVFRQTCGWQYNNGGGWNREWNISVLKCVADRRKGFFAVGALMGSSGSDKADQLIPPDSVSHIEEFRKWERPEEEAFIDSEEMEIG